MWRRQKEPRWCCPVFKDLFECAGQRGAAIAVVENEFAGGPSFAFVYRAIEQGEDFVYDGHVPLTTAGNIRIQFCPNCGTKLERFYSDHWQKLVREDIELV